MRQPGMAHKNTCSALAPDGVTPCAQCTTRLFIDGVKNLHEIYAYGYVANRTHAPPTSVENRISYTADTSRQPQCSLFLELRQAAIRRPAAVRGCGVDVRGYGVDVRGYGVDVRGYGVDVRGCGVDVRCYGVDVRRPVTP
eukprot:1190320-Prorocentrum_minimum.AAC.4